MLHFQKKRRPDASLPRVQALLGRYDELWKASSSFGSTHSREISSLSAKLQIAKSLIPVLEPHVLSTVTIDLGPLMGRASAPGKPRTPNPVRKFKMDDNDSRWLHDNYEGIKDRLQRLNQLEREIEAFSKSVGARCALSRGDLKLLEIAAKGAASTSQEIREAEAFTPASSNREIALLTLASGIIGAVAGFSLTPESAFQPGNGAKAHAISAAVGAVLGMVGYITYAIRNRFKRRKEIDAIASKDFEGELATLKGVFQEKSPALDHSAKKVIDECSQCVDDLIGKLLPRAPDRERKEAESMLGWANLTAG